MQSTATLYWPWTNLQVMELCEGGALLERIEAGKYSEKYIARLTRSILRFVSQARAKAQAAGMPADEHAGGAGMVLKGCRRRVWYLSLL